MSIIPVQDAEPMTGEPKAKATPEAEQGAHISRPEPASDPDETAGRALYRAKADTLARAQVNFARRKVRMEKTKATP